MKHIFTMPKMNVMSVFLLLTMQCSSTASGGWITHKGATFSIEHPQGWVVEVRENGLIEVADNASRALVWPYYVPLEMSPIQAQAQLVSFVNKVFGDYTWGSVSLEGAHSLRVQGATATGKTTVAVLNWVSGAGASLCTFYAAESGSSTFAGLEDTFTHILGSFRPAREGEEGKPPTPKIQYQSYADPSENAFSVSFPAGWKVEGALFRMAPTDVRTHVRMYSPDGQIMVYIGDKELPYFTMPNAMLEWTGFREGSWYSPGYGNNMLVQRYQPGMQFAVQYASGLAKGQVEIISQQDRPELARQLMGLQEMTTYGINQRMDAGEVQFKFHSSQGVRQGYVFANTIKIESDGSGIWHVEQLFAYTATPDKDKEAREVLGNVVKSFQINPEWTRMQSNITTNVSRIVTETNQYISGVIHDTYENKQASQDRVHQRFDDYIRGVERVVDENGTQYEVKSGKNYYWINQFEDVIGTDTYKNPDALRFRELFRIN